MEPVNVVRSAITYLKKFRVLGVKTTFKFNDHPEGVSEIDWLQQGFVSITEHLKSEASENDLIGLTLRNLKFKHNEPGYIAFRPANTLDSNVIWDIFGGIIQSNTSSVSSTDDFEIEGTTVNLTGHRNNSITSSDVVEGTQVNLPVGSGVNERSGYFNNYNEECHKRTGIIVIKNDDNLCLPRAIIVAKAYAKNNSEKELIRKDKAKRQTNKAHKLIQKAQVEIPETGARIAELRKFQTYLKNYKITVYKYGSSGREVYYEGINPDAQLKINLLYYGGHYNVITSLTSAFTCKYYCESCHAPYDRKNDHRCSNTLHTKVTCTKL